MEGRTLKCQLQKVTDTPSSHSTSKIKFINLTRSGSVQGLKDEACLLYTSDAADDYLTV